MQLYQEGCYACGRILSIQQSVCCAKCDYDFHISCLPSQGEDKMWTCFNCSNGANKKDGESNQKDTKLSLQNNLSILNNQNKNSANYNSSIFQSPSQPANQFFFTDSGQLMRTTTYPKNENEASKYFTSTIPINLVSRVS